jgi:endoglucanase
VRRGVNLAGLFDADSTRSVEAIGGATFDVIIAGGFDTVRLPVRWTAHTGTVPPFSIDEAFVDLIDNAVVAATERGLEVIVDVHHAHEVMADPARQEPRFTAIWQQLGERFAHWPPTVAFELLNEPRQPMTAQQWNRLFRTGLAVVRRTNPDRRVLIGPAAMNTIGELGTLDLPDDPNLVATVHYYEPFAFTHQGATWEAGASSWLGTTWGSDGDERKVRHDLETAAEWAGDRAVPLLLGEFGAYERADLDSRIRWTRTVRLEAERLEIPWCYWDFATDFGVFDPVACSWRASLHDALVA